MSRPAKTAILHYSAPPTIGGVESVISSHASVFLENGYPVKVIAGRGKRSAMPEGAEFIKIPQLDSQHKDVLQVSGELAEGRVSDAYRALRDTIKNRLEQTLSDVENVIAHNLFSKHFNLALTEALKLLQEEGRISNCIAWCHDFSVASENDRPELHQGPPWDILRTYQPGINYVVVSKKRQEVLAGIFGIPEEKIQVIYNGFDPNELLGISRRTGRLVNHLSLMDVDLIVLLPVRITKAKNIEFALQVAAELKARACQCLMLLTGPPDPHDPDEERYFQSLRKMRADLGVENNFKFLYEEDPDSDAPKMLEMDTVADLYRLSDMVLMPSHHEGFGMPVLEAGFIGKPVFSTPIPASEEIGGDDIHLISPSSDPGQAAQMILDWAATDPIHAFRVRTRQNYTWQKIFSKQIQPLLIGH